MTPRAQVPILVVGAIILFMPGDPGDDSNSVGEDEPEWKGNLTAEMMALKTNLTSEDVAELVDEALLGDEVRF